MITLAHDMLETALLPMGTATIATTSLALSSVDVLQRHIGICGY